MPVAEFFTSAVPQPGTAAAAARRAEDEGWTGLCFPDSQNLSGDPYVAMTVAALSTTTIRLATGVTNPLTRHAAVTACAIASVNTESGGRAELGIGRGDSALAHIGLAPAAVADLAEYLALLRSYLRGDGVDIERAAVAGVRRLAATVPLDDAPESSRLRWLRGDYLLAGPVPVFAVASGPRVISIAAERADRVVLAVGADPARIRWGIEIARAANPGSKVGAFVNVVVHDDQRRGAELAAGPITSFARFSVMHGSVNGPVSERDRALLAAIPAEYQMRKHFQAGNRAAGRGVDLAGDFAIIGPAGYCIDRLEELADLGVDRFHIVGPALESARTESAAATRRFTSQVLPKLTSV
jgi:5,10-methylenetetrahydromethanopterin reductase